MMMTIRRLLTIVATIICTAYAAAQKNNAPDFAYPLQVEKNADAAITKALHRSDYPAVIEGAVQWSLAKTQVSSDSIPAVLTRLRALETQIADPAAKAMLTCLEATIYTRAYQNNRYVYDRREFTAAAGEDFQLWSKENFARRVDSLTMASILPAEALRAIPIGTYSRVIELDKVDTALYPTLHDFIGTRGIANLQVFNAGSGTLNQALLSDCYNRSLYPPTGTPAGDILRLYHTLGTSFDRTTQAPALVNNTLDMLRFIAANTFYATDDSEQRLGNTEFMRQYRTMLQLTDAAVRFLLATSSDYDPATVYNELTTFRSSHPESRYNNAVTNRINQLSEKEVWLNYNTVALPGVPMQIRATAANSSAVVVKIYNVTSLVNENSGNIRYSKIKAAGMKPVDTATLDFNGKVPFKSDTTFTVVPPAFGIYAIVAEIDGKKPDGNRWLETFTVTALASASANGQPAPRLVAVSPLTGEPQKDVEFLFRPWSRNSGYSLLPGKTGADGFLEIKPQSEGGNFRPRRGDDRYASANNLSGYYDTPSVEDLKVDILTPVNLYHPGDTVSWATVTFSRAKGERQYTLASGRTYTVTLYDANGQEVAHTPVTADDWGRAQGTFPLPTAGLQGRYRIAATVIGSGGRTEIYAGDAWITVSDYRLPTFRLDDVAARAPLGDSAPGVITGKATTFAGFPVADAKVQAQLKVRTGLWIWSRTSPVFASLDATTDADGNFAITLPADLLDSAPVPDGLFIAEVTVTSADGETHDATAQFNRGKPLVITPVIPGTINSAAPFKATVDVLDYRGEKVATTVKYTIAGSDAEKTLPEINGTIPSGDFAGVIRTLPTGKYSVTFATTDSTLAAPVDTPVTFTVYSPGSEISPVKQPLWTPSQATVYATGGKAEITFASDREGSWIWLAVSGSDNRWIDNRWIRARKGVQTVTVAVPDTVIKAQATLMAMRDYKAYSYATTILPESAQRDIEVKIETFRDRVTPGDLEKITFRIIPEHGAQASSAIMASLTNMAIYQLSPNDMGIYPPAPDCDFARVNGWWDRFSTNQLYNVDYTRLSTPSYSAPLWNLYGLNFYPGGIRVMNQLRVRGTANLAAVEESAAEDMVMEKAEAKVYMSAAPAAGAVTADGGSLELEEEIVGKVDEHSVEISVSEKEAAQAYRPSEIPVAFFRPMMTTDADGTLEISYRVPDANTTWILRAAAYNRELCAATAKAKIQASKPLMVNLNAPRFLRSGDAITIPATVMNATDSVCSPAGKIEILDQATGQVLASREFTCPGIAARGQATVELPYEVNTLTAALIVRVKATAGRHTDGEQQLVAVLPAQQDVLESRMFYIPADTSRYTMQLPAIAPGGKAMLNFTENPTWQVVSALPGLRQTSINSSIEAAHTLFSAAVARGLVQRYSEVARTLRRWSENPSDSALVSALSTNSELKMVLLDSTPWVQEALDDTQRLQRLALLLDRAECERVTAEAIDLLAKTADSNGGWYWTARYPEVSEWATTEVLLTLGQLNRMGWLPDNKRLTGLIAGACRWLDAETAAQFRKYPKADYRNYTYLRTLFPDVKQSTASQRVSQAAVQQCISRWKGESIQGKALSALILAAKGYQATAAQVVASLREYATSTPEKGMWWQQLDHTSWGGLDRVGVTAVVLQAFNAVDHKSADVDRIRQWLVLQKQNTAWGSSAVTSLVVASILTSGTEWTVNPAGTAIHVGDKLVQPNAVQYATGEFTTDITADLTAPAQLTIDRQANYPSVGSVVTLERRPMQGVQAVGCAEVSVEKRLTVYRGGQWVESTTFNPGDRVRVTLTVKADDDLDYIVITDPRPAGFEPVSQLPEPVWSDGTCFYRENRDSSTNLYINRLRRGSYILTYELFAAQRGVYTSGAAQLQSQYNPIVTAHSSGSVITVNSNE